MARPEKKLPGCLLQSGTQYPQDEVIVCGLCPNHSDDVGDLGMACTARR